MDPIAVILVVNLLVSFGVLFVFHALIVCRMLGDIWRPVKGLNSREPTTIIDLFLLGRRWPDLRKQWIWPDLWTAASLSVIMPIIGQ